MDSKQRIILFSLLAVLFFILSFSPNAHSYQNRITHGPILGRPGSTSMGIWARTFQPGSSRLIYGTDNERLDQKTEAVMTALDQDNTGWILLKKLLPDTLTSLLIVESKQNAIK